MYAWQLSAQQQTRAQELKQTISQQVQENNLNQAARSSNTLAEMYWNANALEQAATQYEYSVELYKNLGNTNGQRVVQTYLGNIYDGLNNPAKAEAAFKEALRISRQEKNNQNIIDALNNLGTYYKEKTKLQEAIANYEEAAGLALEIQNYQALKGLYASLSNAYGQQGNEDQRIRYYDLRVDIDKRLQAQQMEAMQNQTAQKVQQAKQKAAASEKEKEQAQEELKVKAEEFEEIAEKKDQQIGAITKEKEETEEDLREKERLLALERNITFGLGAGVLLFMVLLIIIFRNYRKMNRINAQLDKRNKEVEKQNTEIQQQNTEINKQNKEINAQNKEIQEQKVELLLQRDRVRSKSRALQKALEEIEEFNYKLTSSINYAKRIQDAMLPPEADFQHLFKDSFILFKPRDIVSGDFYWFAESGHRSIKDDGQGHLLNEPEAAGQKNKIMVAAVDCTGHGVPGAFMSMIGYNYLTEIEGRGITDTGTMLDQLHLSVRKALKQNETDNRDGMDMALVVVDKVKKTLQYSGAKNPMIVIQDGQLEMYKGDKMPIGGIQKEKVRTFNAVELPMNKPTWVYLFSDGYPDQFGGEDGRKFMLKKLKNLLLENHAKPFETQKEILDQALTQWQGTKHKQIDDVLVMGFKVDLAE